MKMPEIDRKKSLLEIEEEFGITKVVRDVPKEDLGYHPSKSYYSNPEPDFEKMRKQYDKVVARNNK